MRFYSLARSLLAGAALLAVAPAAAEPATPGAADDRNARIDAIEANLKGLEAELRELRQQGAASGNTPSATSFASRADTASPPASPATGAAAGRVFDPAIPTSAAVSSLDAGRPVLATRDGRFNANLLAVMQFDVANYFQPAAGPPATDLRRGGAATDTAHARRLADGTNFRRARIGIGGKAFGDFEYTALFDFGGAGVEDNGHVQELWLQYSGLKPAHIRAGAFPPFIGLEDAGSTNGMLFLERPASADIARGLAGGDFREAGQVTINTGRLFASGAVTGRLVNTVGASAMQPYGSQQGFVGRLAALPYRDDDTLVHVGVHGSYVGHPADNGGPDAAPGTPRSAIQLRERPELRVDGTRLIDTGAVSAAHAYTVGAELAAQHKNLMIQAEYEHIGITRDASAISDPSFHGFYVEGSWLITGQTRRFSTGNYAFDGPKVGVFDPHANQWGAWELALRYADTNLNYHAGSAGTAPAAEAIRGGDQRIITAGVNWYLNPVMRIMLDYQHVRISRLSPNAATFLTPIGSDIGQTYDTAAARFQFAF